ncbi:MAG: bifunctional (p)ppGpp synthetase/guanosine-3',5'-bis(diphosphate) 3'-pyrophosphohydrolase [Bacteroidales bacterium]|nr:bifunctional (p)ppGpp synthetase/guanosine-3',5'-bis(diphosphate) 3'-pyrophosphohydrolase [Candidatus Physcousia equi]
MSESKAHTSEERVIILQRAKEVFDAMQERCNEKDMKRLHDAFQLADEAHALQRRKSGEPYIFHPIAVARIAACEMRLDADCVITAFLHDVVEDTDFTNEDVRLRFGNDVAFLVDVVTKKKKEVYDTTKQVDNYRQLLNSLHYDIRALLIKIADRLHNMRTLGSMRADKQMKIAGETDSFYAPLANRLGLIDVKSDLENLSFKYRCKLEYSDLERWIAEDEKSNEERLIAFTNRIEYVLQKVGIDAKAEVYYRRPYSLWRRMRQDNVDFKHVDNRYYVRITYSRCRLPLSEKSACIKIYSTLTDYFKERPGTFQNLIDQAKENSYRCLRVMLLSQSGIWEDVQICSRRMVEASKVGCMAEIGDNIGEWIKRFRGVLRDIAKQEEQDNLLEKISASLYYDDVTVFTTSGQSIILPKGSTAIDFAFKLGAEYGLHARYARINGKLSSIKTILLAGDCVEIASDNDAHPNEDWMEHVSTYAAKTALHEWKRRQDGVSNLRCPICQPLPGGELIGILDAQHRTIIHRRSCAQAILLASKFGDNVLDATLNEEATKTYPITFCIKAVDRFHLLVDVIDHITNVLGLSIESVNTSTVDSIAEMRVTFFVHSVAELVHARNHIYSIHGVDEVRQIGQ